MATQALRYLSQSDGFIPQATGQVIAFVRKESEFALNSYVQYVPTTTKVGLYALLGRDQFIRVISSERFAWEDGDDRPTGEWNKIPYQWVPFRTFRRDYPWRIGYEALEQTSRYGSWNPKLAHMDMVISQCMTERTNRVQTLLQTAASWPSTNTASANTLNNGAGKLTTASSDPNSPNYLAIFKTLSGAAQRVNLLTNAKVKPGQLVTIVSPGLALAMAQTSEMVEYCKSSPVAKDILENGLDPQYTLWGLPKTYRGFKFIVEDTPYVNVNPNTTNQSGTEGQVPEASLSTSGRQYAWQDTSAVMVARPGGLDGEYGAPSFSTVQIYHKGGLLEVEAFEDPKNRRVDGHVSEDTVAVLAAAFAGFQITGTV